MKIRNNPLIWRIAEFMFDSTVMEGDEDFKNFQEWYRNKVYDRAAVLYSKMLNNAFTGEDNHE